MVTMKRIAEICGVSRGTVDRALNGRGRVSRETADHIRHVARQLGYQPNPAGKALAARIALVVGNKNVLGHRQRLEGFQQRMRQVRDFQLAAVIEHEDDDILAYDAVCRLLREHPEIDAISILAAGGYGVCRAVLQLPEERRPLVIGFDTVPTTVEMMKKGLIKATIYQHPYRQGHTAINKAFEYLVHGRRPDHEAYILKNEIKLLENL